MALFGPYTTHAVSPESNKKVSIVSWHWTQRKSFKGKEDRFGSSEVHLMWHIRLSKHLFVPFSKDNYFFHKTDVQLSSLLSLISMSLSWGEFDSINRRDKPYLITTLSPSSIQSLFSHVHNSHLQDQVKSHWEQISLFFFVVNLDFEVHHQIVPFFIP